MTGLRERGYSFVPCVLDILGTESDTFMKPVIALAFFLFLISFASFAQESAQSGTAKYSGRIVVFFEPSQADFDSLAKDDGAWIDEVLSDFQYSAEKVLPFLKERGIRSDVTSADFIEIAWSNQTFRFDRHKGDQGVGMIMSDGIHMPLFLYGVHTDDGLKEEFVKYFRIKSYTPSR